MAPNIIKIFGGTPTPCARCKGVERGLNAAIKEMGLDAQVVHMYALSDEADKYDILATPAVVINEKVVVRGRVPSKEELMKILKEEFG